MRKIAVVFLLAVAVPSLVLAGLALRSLRDQRLAQEREEILLAEATATSLAAGVEAEIDRALREFVAATERSLSPQSPPATADAPTPPMAVEPGLDLTPTLAPPPTPLEPQPVRPPGDFDQRLRSFWRPAGVAFVVEIDGVCVSPSPLTSPAARRFRSENDRFLCSVEAVEVAWNSPKGKLAPAELAQPLREKSPAVFASTTDASGRRNARNFREIVGDSVNGTIARFVQDELQLLFWHRPTRHPGLVYGAQVNLAELQPRFAPLLTLDSALTGRFVALLRDDSQGVVAASQPGFPPTPRRPLAAADIGDKLPHWRVDILSLDPARAGAAAATARLTLALLVGVLLLAIGVGSWLIALDLQRQLQLVRQQTSFVANVSHELKTPLTSIRLFAELLGEAADGSQDHPRRRQFSGIIQTEAARLTRLLDQVLDFGRLERGELRYQSLPLDLTEVARCAAETCRPQLTAAGLILRLGLPAAPVRVRGDFDGLSQILFNLLSNAGKYASAGGEVSLELIQEGSHARLEVSDRGPGIPPGQEERIFEEFFRGNDSLASGIPGCGLGLTLARRVATAHGGTLTARSRPGGGAVFTLRLPLEPSAL